MFNIGDAIVCISSVYDHELEVGKTYFISHIDSNSLYVKIVGSKKWYFSTSFQSFRDYKKPYSSCKSMEIDSINEEYGPVIPKVQSNEPFKKAQIQYHLNKLKELTQ